MSRASSARRSGSCSACGSADRRGRRRAAADPAERRSAASQHRQTGAVAARTILHVDMDAFYVSVELRRRPELRGQPVVVGGTGRRGVVAAASYEARRFGVHSAMPSATRPAPVPARRVPAGDHAAYAAASREVHEIFEPYTPLVEPLALDEAFLDVTGARPLLGDGVDDRPPRSAHDVHDELGLTCSVGVAPNKFLAKLASVEAKPRADAEGVQPGPGVVEVRPGRGAARSSTRCRSSALWGVGPATLERLQRLGVPTVGDLAALDEPCWSPRSGKPTAGTSSTWPRPRRPAGGAATGS